VLRIIIRFVPVVRINQRYTPRFNPTREDKVDNPTIDLKPLLLISKDSSLGLQRYNYEKLKTKD